MHELFQFMGDHPWLTVLLLLLSTQTVYSVLYCLPARMIRHMNIRRAGWPPSHLDADGDFKQEDERE